MKIAHITSVHDSNDTRIYQRMLKSLSEYGYELHYYAKNKPDDLPSAVTFIKLPTYGNKFNRVLFSSFNSYKKITKQHTTNTIIHFHDPELMIMGLLLKLRGYKVIYDVHEDVPKYIMSSDWIPGYLKFLVAYYVRLIEWFSTRFFDAIIVVTETIGKRFPTEKTFLVQNFPGANELYIENHTKKEIDLIYLGEASEIRGLREVVTALEQTASKANLTLIGRIQPKSFLDELSSMQGWNYVNFVGLKNRTEVSKLLAKAKVGIVTFLPYPNHVEAQPNKLFEYMSTSLAVIASNFEKWKDIVEVHNTGICVDPTSPNEIAEAIDYLMNHEKEREQMGINGREIILKYYSWENEFKNLLKTYSFVNCS